MIDVNAIGKTIVDKVQTSHGISDERTCGKIIYSGDGIIHISGLSDVKYNELLEVQGGYKALALNLERDSVGAVLFCRVKTKYDSAIWFIRPARRCRCRSGKVI